MKKDSVSYIPRRANLAYATKSTKVADKEAQILKNNTKDMLPHKADALVSVNEPDEVN